MVKKLIFLHGAGADKDAYHNLMESVAKKVKADLISFNAPYLHSKKKDKYVWFNKFENNNRRDAVKEEYYNSVKYVKSSIAKLNTPLKDIVIIGHSQGGGIAAEIALSLSLRLVISICGDMPYNLSYKKLTNTPIYWLEASQDEYISEERKQSYKLLQKIDANLYYKLLPNARHSYFEDDFNVFINGLFKE